MMKKMIYTFPDTEESVTIVSDLPKGFNATNLLINGSYVEMWDGNGDIDNDEFFRAVTGRDNENDPFDDRWSEDFTDEEIEAVADVVRMDEITDAVDTLRNYGANILWYAVMLTKDDNDWGYGSLNKQTALTMLEGHRAEYPDAYIAVIDRDVCIDEIRD